MKQKDLLKKKELDRISKGRKREKKSEEQLNLLESEYLKNPKWSYQLKVDIALKINLTFG